jgi:hypothetical protein
MGSRASSAWHRLGSLMVLLLPILVIVFHEVNLLLQVL